MGPQTRRRPSCTCVRLLARFDPLHVLNGRYFECDDWIRYDLGLSGPPLEEAPTTACFDCGGQVPVSEVYLSIRDPEMALCEDCFQNRQARGPSEVA